MSYQSDIYIYIYIYYICMYVCMYIYIYIYIYIHIWNPQGSPALELFLSKVKEDILNAWAF